MYTRTSIRCAIEPLLKPFIGDRTIEDQLAVKANENGKILFPTFDNVEAAEAKELVTVLENYAYNLNLYTNTRDSLTLFDRLFWVYLSIYVTYNNTNKES
jgi:hypothetical protein